MVAKKTFEGKIYRKVDSFREMENYLKSRGASTKVTVPKVDGVYEFYEIDGHLLYIRTDSVCYEYNEVLYLHFESAKHLTEFIEAEYGTFVTLKINSILKDTVGGIQYCNVLISFVSKLTKLASRLNYNICIDDAPNKVEEN